MNLQKAKQFFSLEYKYLRTYWSSKMLLVHNKVKLMDVYKK